MKRIKLTMGQYALVDDGNYEWLNSYKWHAKKGHNTYYARRNVSKTTQLMHRLIMDTWKRDLWIDHIDHNGLNNLVENMRIVDKYQSARNIRVRKGCTSVYKGVYWNTRDKKWEATIYMKPKQTYIGQFDNEDDAGLAYNRRAVDLFGEYAFLNEIRNTRK